MSLAIPSPPPDFPTMERQPDSLDKLFALATANNYKKEKHKEKYADPTLYNYVDEIVYDQNCVLRHYII
jgi:hypothetical protein